MKRAVIGIGVIVAFSVFLLLFARDADAPSESQPDQPAQNQSTVPGFDKQKYSVSDPASVWVVVNKTRPLNPITYAPGDLISAGGGKQMRKEAAEALTQLISAGKTEGLTIRALSAYRSYARQEVVYKNEVAANGQAIADSQSAKPGRSEHQTGWAVDLGNGNCDLQICFGNTSAGKWLAGDAYKYGFILRYPEGKQSITGYIYEPWHFRYVGKDLSTEMHNQGVQTMEEFFNIVPASQPY